MVAHSGAFYWESRTICTGWKRHLSAPALPCFCNVKEPGSEGILPPRFQVLSSFRVGLNGQMDAGVFQSDVGCTDTKQSSHPRARASCPHGFGCAESGQDAHALRHDAMIFAT